MNTDVIDVCSRIGIHQKRSYFWQTSFTEEHGFGDKSYDTQRGFLVMQLLVSRHRRGTNSDGYEESLKQSFG